MTELYCVGNAFRGRCGVECIRDDQTIPLPISISLPPSLRVTRICCGESHTLVATSSGALYAFGDNVAGQLGTGDSNFRSSPCLIELPAAAGISVRQTDEEDETFNQNAVVSVGCGSYHSACVTATGAIYMWGETLYGKCGTAPSRPLLAPTQVMTSALLSAGVRQVACGAHHSICVDNSGKLYVVFFGSLIRGNHFFIVRLWNARSTWDRR